MLFAIGLQACSSAPVVSTDKALRIGEADKPGMIVGTIGAMRSDGAREGSPFSDHQLLFRRLEDAAEGRVAFHLPDFLTAGGTDIEEGRIHANSFALQLPAGRYEVFSTEFGSVAGTFRPVKVFSIPFLVEPGVATYLGRMIARPVFGENFIGVQVPEGAVFDVFDASDRDRPLIQTVYPEVQDMQWRSEPLEPPEGLRHFSHRGRLPVIVGDAPRAPPPRQSEPTEGVSEQVLEPKQEPVDRRPQSLVHQYFTACNGGDQAALRELLARDLSLEPAAAAPCPAGAVTELMLTLSSDGHRAAAEYQVQTQSPAAESEPGSSVAEGASFFEIRDGVLSRISHYQGAVKGAIAAPP